MIALVTDRTESDVLLKTEKGSYGASDLNRVELAVKEINSHFAELGISASLQTKTDWMLHSGFSAEQYPAISQMKRYLDNVKTVRELFHIPLDLPDRMSNLTFEGANDIERVLQKALSYLEARKSFVFYSGEIFSGEEY